MPKKNSYHLFANFYDLLTENVLYEKRGHYFDTLISKFSYLEGKKILDLACGTGSLSREFDVLGYHVEGLDLSKEMVQVASAKYPYIPFSVADMRNFQVAEPFDIVICALDSLNHLSTEGDLVKAFQSVARALKKDGLFLFDMNTVYKHEHVLADNTFVFDTEEVYLVWDNWYHKNERVTTITLDFFVPDEDSNNGYFRFSEQFDERGYTIEEVQGALQAAGLSVLGVYHEDSEEILRDDSERLVYVVRK